MPFPAYSKRLWNQRIPVGSGNTLSPAPAAGRVWIIKFLTAFPLAANSEGAVYGPGGLYWLSTGVLPSNSSWSQNVMLVLAQNESIGIQLVAGGLDVSAHGYDVSA